MSIIRPNSLQGVSSPTSRRGMDLASDSDLDSNAACFNTPRGSQLV